MFPKWVSVTHKLILTGLIVLLVASSLSAQFPEVYEVAWNPVQNTIAVARDDDVYLYNADLELLHQFNISTAEEHWEIEAISWSPDGQKLGIAGQVEIDGFRAGQGFQIWDMTSFSLVTSILDADFDLPMTWSPDSNRFAILVKIGNLSPSLIQIYSATNGTLIMEFQPNISGTMNQLIWHPVEEQLAIITITTIYLVDIQSELLLASYSQTTSETKAVFSPSGNQIAVADALTMNGFQILDTSNLQPVQSFQVPIQLLLNIAWGNNVIAASGIEINNDSITLWNLATGEINSIIEDIVESDMSWNPEGTQFVINDIELGFSIRDGVTGEVIARIRP